MTEKIILYFILFLLLGCRTLTPFNGTFANKFIEYHYGVPSAEWKHVHEKGADFAFISAHDDAVILIFSKCAHKTDAPLESLAEHLLLGMTEQQLINSKLITQSNREALVNVYSAKLDGVPRTLKIFAQKANNCAFQLVLASAPHNFARHEPDFDKVVAGFSFGGKQ